MVQFANLTFSLLEASGWMVSQAQQRLGLVSDSLATPPNNSTAAAMPYTLPDLGYAYDALEPYFDEMTMQIHHSKHHQTYITNLNNALPALPSTHQTLPIDHLIADIPSLPPASQKAVRNAGGGHANHSFFWKSLKLNTAAPAADSPFASTLTASFGSMDEFKTKFEAAAATVFGSGWAWLVLRPGSADELAIVTTANQDSPLMGEAVVPGASGTPVIGLDVWEHAYYLKYQNRRPDYIKAFWSVLDWEVTEKRFEEAVAAAKK